MTDPTTNPTLIGGIEKREIRIVDYNLDWPAQYRLHAEIITRSLGDVLLRIEHVGSTSVPGLGAKPIIDILAVVVNSADEAAYVPALEAAGYELRVREPDFQEHRMLRTIAKDVHVHVFSPGAPDITRLLTFRNRLRTNAGDRALYEQTKHRLAEQSWADMNAYAEAKTEVVERIIAAAIADGEEVR